MIFFPAFSTAVFCLWALLLASTPTYTSMLTIPALVSPVLTPLLSLADGPTILILSEVCLGTIPITLPTCNPLDAPVPPNPSALPGPRRIFELTVTGLLVLGCVGIALCTRAAIRPADWEESITSAPSDYPAHPRSTPPSLPSFPPTLRETGPSSDWTSLSQFDPPCSLHREALARDTGVSVSGRVFRSSPADSGYQGSPLISRRAASKQNQSRLRFVTVADVGSPEAPSLMPLFNHTEHQGSEGSGLPYVATGDPFWVARTAFRHRNDQVSQGGYGNQGSRLGGGAAASLKAPSKLVVNTPSLSSLPLKSHVSDISGFPYIPRAEVPIQVKRTGDSDREGAREARRAFLRLQAERGYAAPSRLYHNFDNGTSAPSPARSPNIQALRDLLESGREMLRRLSERRSAQPTSPNTRPPSLSRPSTAKRRVTPTFPTPSAASQKTFKSSERGPIDLEESRSTHDTDLSKLIEVETAAHKVNDGPSYSVPPFETVLADLRKGASSVDIPGLTSADVGLWLLRQAINEQGEKSLYLDSEAPPEVTISVDLTLGELPSFLDDIPDSPARHYSQHVVVTNDQDTYPIPHLPTPVVTVASSSAFSEDTAIVNSPLSPIPHNPTPLPPVLPFATSLSFGRIGGFLNDIWETPVHRFSHPAPIPDDPHNLVPSSSLDGLEPAEDQLWLRDQSIPLSPIESRPSSPIPPFERVISQVRVQKTATQEDHLHSTARDPETSSVGKSRRLETSMSLERIADFLGDIWAPPVRKFSNQTRFGGNRGVNPPALPAISSTSALCIPEDLPYQVDQSTPGSLAESSSGSATSTPSFKDPVQNFPGTNPSPDVHSTASNSHSLLDLGSPCVSSPFHPSSASSCSCSSPSGRSLTTENPKITPPLCEESSAGLDVISNP